MRFVKGLYGKVIIASSCMVALAWWVCLSPACIAQTTALSSPARRLAYQVPDQTPETSVPSPANNTLSIPSPVNTAPSITLDQAKEMARENNRDLASLRLNLLLAVEKTREARSKALPQISSSFTYTTHEHQPGHYDPQTQKGGPGADRQTSDASLTLEQSLFHLGIWAGIQVARNYQQMERLAQERFGETLDYLVTESYLGILRLQREEGVLRELEKNTREHLRDTQNFYEEGLVQKTDLLKTELMLSQVQRDLLHTRNSLQKLWTSFRILLGCDPGMPCQIQDVEINAEQEEAVTRGLPELRQEALLFRKDLKRLQAEEGYLENILKAQKSRRYPVVSAFGAWDYTSNEYDLNEENITGGIKLTFPLFTGFGTTAQISQARTELAQHQLKYKGLLDQINQEVESAYLDLQEAQANLEIAHKEVAQAEENLRINRDLYRESMATNTDVLDAQSLLAQAKNHLNNAQYDRILAIRRIALATGKDG